MTDERFNELMRGALYHRMPMVVMTRLFLALRYVVDTCGAAGELALEEWCDDRDDVDRLNTEEG
jgi:hypothetical protein